MARKQTTFDFGDGNGPVPAHRHRLGGGWVADTAHVDRTVYVDEDARVYDDARILGEARLFTGGVRVAGDAFLSGDIVLSGQIAVRGDTVLTGTLNIRGPLVIEATPVVLSGVFGTGGEDEAIFVESPLPVVSIGRETHPLAHWRQHAHRIVRKSGHLKRGDATRILRLFDVVYGPVRKRHTKK